jgi:CheY-like chemotaxis protein
VAASAVRGHSPRKCPICKRPIETAQLPSVLLKDGRRQIHIDCYVRIETERIERLRPHENLQAVGGPHLTAGPVTIEQPISKPQCATVLIADDFAAWRALIGKILSPSHWKIVGEAQDGIEALDIATDEQPDIILLDVELPGMNGIKAAGLIRKTSPNSTIVFLTQNDDADIRQAALSTGAAAYILKANAASELLNVMSAIRLASQAAV